jgi:putative ABC transport system permease protein
MAFGARSILNFWLRGVAGDQLARDILGDVAESGGGFWRIAGIAAAITARRGTEATQRAFRTRARLGSVASEFRYAFRSLCRAPWYSGTVIGVIAVAMALTTTVFAVVDGVLFKTLPYPNVGEIYAVQGGWRLHPDTGTTTVSWSDVTASQTAIPEARFALARLGDRASIYGAPARSASVSEQFFDVIGQPLLMGGFRPSDFAARPDSDAVVPVVLTYPTWQRQFGGDSTVPCILVKLT